MENNSKNFENLVDRDKYQVFIFYCPAYFPFNFFRHPWVVLNKKGEISRWEIRHYINKESGTHIFVNNQKPFEGISKTLFIKSKWGANLLGLIEGEVAISAIEFVEKSKENYPYINNYGGCGPNSNTYVDWVLNKFPEFKIKLSWQFIGKNYKIK